MHVHSGDALITGAVIAEDDLCIRVACGDLTMEADLSAGDDISIKVCRGAVNGTGSITAADDVTIHAHWDVVFEGLIQAGDWLCIKSARGDVILN